MLAGNNARNAALNSNEKAAAATPVGQPDDDAPRALAGTPLTRKGQQTYAKICQAGRELLEEHGYFEATVLEITERTGIALGTYYRYFENKDALFLRLLELLLDDLNKSTDVHWDSGDMHENLRRVTRGYLTAYFENRRLIAGLLQMAAAVPACAARWWELRSRVYGRMQRYIAGTQLVEVADPKLSAVALGSMTEQFAYHWFVEGAKHDGDMPTIDAAADTIALLWFRAVYQQ
ncbi:TetR/AcrR family transcriptional regulator [Nocardia gipuzkoensis]|uniref:TetR/AcrR family transcriptional regulator n=1 Tax=Nocardia gipuzkoensis TaxID=2749991 RepID=UPI00237ED82D|nr:TetR/AcrR family transcriptional regulator [Nocardia gipuzkoensis]MDE1674875.1 helix-turn-helix domain containing protein [Nocardia gipuzkoensis]